MNQIAKIGIVLLIGTMALAALGVGYAMWSKTLTIAGTVNTGNLSLAFVDDPTYGPGDPKTSPFTNDDNVVNNAAKDPFDTGRCPQPPFDEDGDGYIDEDWVDGLDNDGDLLIDEDPPGKNTSCDPRCLCTWLFIGDDDDGDGLVDEDPVDGIDNDGDGRLDEDPIGKWSCAPTSNGPDIGVTVASVDTSDYKTLYATLTKASVTIGGGYAPTVYYDVTNNGSVPIVLAQIAMDQTQTWELYDRNGDSVIQDVDNDGNCDVGVDECAQALIPTLSGLAVGMEIMPGGVLPGTLKFCMTPGSKPGKNYGTTVAITGYQYNEP
jgi:hypothetical protein